MFISSCAVCSRPTFDLKAVCSECSKATEKEKFDSFLSRCPVCYRPVLSSDYVCTCSNSDDVFRIYSIFDYKAPVIRRILEKWKFDGNRKLTPFVAQQYFRILSLLNLSPDKYLLQGVPCSKQGFRKRKFDQVADVILYLKRKYNYISTNLLSYSDSIVHQQKELGRKERQKNAEEKYVFNRNYSRTGIKEIVLLDDITTTGYSLRTCRKLIERNGFEIKTAITLLAEL